MHPRTVQHPARSRQLHDLRSVPGLQGPEQDPAASGSRTRRSCDPALADRKAPPARASAGADERSPLPVIRPHCPLARRARAPQVRPRPGGPRRRPPALLGPYGRNCRPGLSLPGGCNAPSGAASAGSDSGQRCLLHIPRRSIMPSQNDCRCEKKSCGCVAAEPCRCGPGCSCVKRCECGGGCACAAAK
jgi:hypothetical protein